jgi:hypothetical protein
LLNRPEGRKKGQQSGVNTHNIIGSKDRILVVVGIPGDPKKGGLGQQALVLANVVVNPVFSHKVRDFVFAIGQRAAGWEGGPDVVLQGRGLRCCFSDVDTLSAFHVDGNFRSVYSKRFEKVCDGIDCIRSLSVTSV